MQYSKQWLFFQPLRGGARFIVFQIIGWTFLATSILLPLVPLVRCCVRVCVCVCLFVHGKQHMYARTRDPVTRGLSYPPLPFMPLTVWPCAAGSGVALSVTRAQRPGHRGWRARRHQRDHDGLLSAFLRQPQQTARDVPVCPAAARGIDTRAAVVVDLRWAHGSARVRRHDRACHYIYIYIQSSWRTLWRTLCVCVCVCVSVSVLWYVVTIGHAVE